MTMKTFLAMTLAFSVVAMSTSTSAAQDRPATRDGGSPSTSPGDAGSKVGKGWSPVGAPGMFTGIDTGVTRGNVGKGGGTTGTYGAGSSSSGIGSPPAETESTNKKPSASTGSGASGRSR